MEFYVYQLRREDSVLPFYIGKGSGNRMVKHVLKSQLKSVTLKNSKIKSAMAEGVRVLSEKLVDRLSEPEALALEVLLIAQYGRVDTGTGILTNMTDGGEGTSGNRLSADHKLAISKARKGSTLTLAHREAVAKAQTGRVHSTDHRSKVAAARTGKSLTAETKEKIRLANTGRVPTEAARAKMRAAKLGKKRL